MSDKDPVAQAALRALSRKNHSKTKAVDKSAAAPKTTSSKSKPSEKGRVEKGRAEKSNIEAKVDKQTAIAAIAGIKAKKQDTTATEQERSTDYQGGGLGFLFLILAVPLAVVGGLFGYAHMQENAGKTSNDISTKAEPAKVKAQNQPKTSSTETLAKLKPQKPAMEKHASDGKKTALAANTDKTKTTLAKSNAKIVSNAAPTLAAAPKIHWDYKSTDWASIDTSYKTCGEGHLQSPINIIAANGPAGPNFLYSYFPSNGKVRNNGHTVQVDLDKGNSLLVNGKSYDLVQFHFHTPSENVLNGKQAPMEVHLVHKNEHGQLVVVAVMIFAGESNQLLDQIPVPATKGKVINSNGAHINPSLLLPNDRRSYTFSGSLTTPPCTQNVGWIVMRQSLSISPASLAKFQKVLGKNNRPLQPGNGRTIYNSY